MIFVCLFVMQQNYTCDLLKNIVINFAPDYYAYSQNETISKIGINILVLRGTSTCFFAGGISDLYSFVNSSHFSKDLNSILYIQSNIILKSLNVLKMKTWSEMVKTQLNGSNRCVAGTYSAFL